MKVDSLEEAVTWIGAMTDRLEPAARSRLARVLGADLRRANADRIKAQEDPDGAAFTPRKRQDRPNLRGKGGLRAKKGRLKRKAAARKDAMFLKLVRLLKARSNADTVRVGFGGGAAGRIARVHHEGLVDQVTRRKDSPRVAYPERRLLGLSDEDRDRLLDRVLQHLEL